VIVDKAKLAVRSAIKGADNDVAAARALLRVARSFQPEYDGERDAIREVATAALKARGLADAKATAWAILDAGWTVEERAPAPAPPAEPDRNAPRSLAEILADPDVIRPPVALVPRMAWTGRVTLLAAREKIGKSTLAGAAVAALSSGVRFMGEPTHG